MENVDKCKTESKISIFRGENAESQHVWIPKCLNPKMFESQHFSGVLPLSPNHNSSLDTTLRHVLGACVKKEVFHCLFQLNLQLKMVELPCQIYTLDSVIFELSLISFMCFLFLYCSYFCKSMSCCDYSVLYEQNPN